MLALLLYRSKPWKQPIWKNKPLFLTISINTILIVGVSLFTSGLSGLGIQPIGATETVVVWLIILGSGLVCFGFNLGLERMCFRTYLNQRSEFSSLSSMHEIG